MRSYTDSKGNKITVSEEHLMTAVKLKKELQKSSPSRKCNWKLLSKLMSTEGFHDSDSNESYRCMIKDFQKSIGELPEAPKYADMVSDGKLQSIKNLVGEISMEKRENQHVLKELNKVKREVIDYALIAEQIGNAFKDYDWSSLKFEYEELQKGNNAMVVCLSDLHIGALVDTDINTYNYEVAKERMNEYLNRVIGEVKTNNVNWVHVMNLGDSIENPYMHNLMFDCEFTMAEQIVRASDIIIKFLIELSKHVNVTYSGIAGNHDRFHENKNMGLDGDNAVKAINYAIESFIRNSEIERVSYVQAKDYEHSFLINGLNIKAIHGDLDSINDANLIAKHTSLDDTNYSIIVMGHYHHHYVKEQGLDKTVVCFGSLKGADGYGAKTRRISRASQGYIIVDEFGNYEIRSVKL